MRSLAWHRGRAVGLVALVFLLDQLTKAWAVAALTDGRPGSWCDWLRGVEHPIAGRVLVVSEQAWRFRYAENKGTMFGLFGALPGPARTAFFAGAAVLALFALRWLAQAGRRHQALRFCAPLAVGAALGNYFDRMRLGYVIDFIEWHVGDVFWWPVFNVADSAWWSASSLWSPGTREALGAASLC